MSERCGGLICVDMERFPKWIIKKENNIDRYAFFHSYKQKSLSINMPTQM